MSDINKEMTWGEELDALHEEDAKERDCSELDRMLGSQESILHLLVYIYNVGYLSGHEDTVESRYVDVMPIDMQTYHEDEVREIVKELEDLGHTKINV